MIDKYKIHNEICLNLHQTYVAKNTDYGDSFAKTRSEFPEAILIRLSDKFERIKSLYRKSDRQVKDESIEDTLLDLANYAIMEVVERRAMKRTPMTNLSTSLCRFKQSTRTTTNILTGN